MILTNTTVKRFPREEASKLYDMLYEQGTNLLKMYDPCRIHTNSDGEVKCFAGKPCCEYCKHLTPTGCSVQALSCKLWLCHQVRAEKDNQPLLVAFATLKQVGRAIGFPPLEGYTCFRETKEEHLAKVQLAD